MNGHKGRIRTPLLRTLAVATIVGLCGGATAVAAPRGTRPGLTDSHPCAGQPGFTCSTLTVPLDHRGTRPGSLKLQVAVADNTDARKGVLFFLSGGPGQPGAPFITHITHDRLPEIAKNYRFAMIDQRGTGEFGAITCPKLQAQMGSSDIVTPTPDAVGECAGVLGDKAGLYGTDQTVADLDMLRQALGADKITVDGTSYGSFVAERYAIAHPHNVRSVVLDSVVPHHFTAADSLYLSAMRAEATVLRDACAAPPTCGFDPADDLAQVIRDRSTADGVHILDMIVSYEFVDPTYRDPNPADLPPGGGDLIGALHTARNGDPARLNALVTNLPSGGDPVTEFSAGLHAATLCTDMRFPWGSSATPRPVRPFLLDVTKNSLNQSDVWPYTPNIAISQGFIQSCLPWPTGRTTPNPAEKLPNVPVLLLNGDHDLSTPIEWARLEVALAPHGTLVTVKGAAHSVQNRERGHVGRDALDHFLND
ncbi:alpha/beta fold hydrolase [Actinocrispum wychmicini]|uniref:TAP-like protein n=1 Tax=Actinocrispum wychmicini TaxID=1213861 RepID=A0A4R2J8J2_9PSEU|nr:alpha/beta hydrolase [Actinocrispum wychmicini]TCO55591.1 TAP-like protein [Actinocrispum wychmicini]